MEEDSSVNELTSRFKDSLNQIYRIDRLWQDTHSHSRSGQLIKWNWDLDRVWCELAGDLKEDSKSDKEIIEKFNKFKKRIAAAKEIKDLYEALTEKELFLRRLQNQQGKGTAYMDADEDTFE